MTMNATQGNTAAETAVPTPDKASILAALETLYGPNDVIELRVFPKGRKTTHAGYFDPNHREMLAEYAAQYSFNGAAVYTTLNPVEPQLISRYANRMETNPQATTTDKQVTRRRWLLIDLDPVRPSGTSATDIQVEAAMAKAIEVHEYLKTMNWPSPLTAMSGNGFHLLYALDLPNDDEAKRLVKTVLERLGSRFDDEDIKVDRTVFNAARICKLYGTVASKGDHTELTPWRASYLMDTPLRSEVTRERLDKFIASPQDEPVHSAFTRTVRIAPTDTFQLEEFFGHHGISYTVDDHEGRERFKLAVCPFNPEHVNGEAAAFRKPSGELGFKCQHDSCAEFRWKDFRSSIEGRVNHDDAPVIDHLNSVAMEDCAHVGAWPAPTPLPSALPPVIAFDEDFLPVALRAWVMDIAHRMQCPPDFVAVSALVALSSLVGARAVVQPKALDTWQVVPNLWGVVVGRPGVKKSPALAESLKPLTKMQEKEVETWQCAVDAWTLDCRLVEMQKEANGKEAKRLASTDPVAARALLESLAPPPEPVVRRYIVNDATVEKLGELMQQNPWGILSYRDELYGLLTGMDKPGQEGARAFMLQSYDGNQGYTFDRIGRGTVQIPRVCLSLVGGIQPGRVQEYVRGAVSGGSSDDGLMQRFGLAVWPDIKGKFIHVDQLPDTAAKEIAWAVFERLAGLQAADNTDPLIWRFDEAAQALFVDWLVGFEEEIRGDELHPALISHLSKYRKLIPALALLFALVDTPDSECVIHEAELMRALTMGKYLRSHADRLYAAAVMPETESAANLLAKIQAGKLTSSDGAILETFTPRQVAAKGWRCLGKPADVRRAAELLMEYDFLRVEYGESSFAGGRPSERYAINPAVIAEIQAQAVPPKM